VSLFISLIIYLIAIDKPPSKGITTISKDKAVHTLIEYNMNPLYTYSDFI